MEVESRGCAVFPRDARWLGRGGGGSRVGRFLTTAVGRAMAMLGSSREVLVLAIKRATGGEERMEKVVEW